VSAGEHRAAVNFPLSIAGHVTGAVVNAATGLPMSGLEVYAFDLSGAQVSASLTDPNGQFSLALSPGNYRFAAADPAHRFGTSFYSSATAFATAMTVSISAGQTVSGLQFRMAAVAPAVRRRAVHLRPAASAGVDRGTH
jgi:hypothetical protein